jgi:hypothetical protein
MHRVIRSGFLPEISDEESHAMATPDDAPVTAVAASLIDDYTPQHIS